MKKVSNHMEDKIGRELVSILEHQHFFEREENIDVNMTYQEFLADKKLVILAIRNGITYSFFSAIQQLTPFSDSEWANFLDISSKSLHRYKVTPNFKFKRIHSEKIIELAEVTVIGLDVFGNMEKFKLWLDTPNFALGNLRPFELLNDSYGKELVLSELTRINHGILV